MRASWPALSICIESQIYEWLNASIRLRDSYPLDSLPKGFSYRVAEEVAKALRAKLCPELATLRNLVGIEVELEGLQLENVTKRTYPLSRLYHPLFDSEWVELYASKAIEAIKDFFPNPECLWLSISITNRSDEIWIYATPFVPPPTTIEIAGKYLVIVVGKRVALSNIDVTIHGLGMERPYLEIVPRGEACRLRAPRCVEASITVTSANYTILAIPIDELENLGIELRNLVVVWIDNVATYAKKLSLRNA